MDALRRLFEELKFAKVETFIASGNVVFESRSSDAESLELKIENHLEKKLGYAVATFLRTDAEVMAIANSTVFSTAEREGTYSMYVGLLKSAQKPAVVEQVRRWRTPAEDVRFDGRELYWLARVKHMDSEFAKRPLDRVLDGPVTFRNANTCARLAAKYPPR